MFRERELFMTVPVFCSEEGKQAAPKQPDFMIEKRKASEFYE